MYICLYDPLDKTWLKSEISLLHFNKYFKREKKRDFKHVSHK